MLPFLQVFNNIEMFLTHCGNVVVVVVVVMVVVHTDPKWPPLKLLVLTQLYLPITTTFHPHTGPKWPPIKLLGLSQLYPPLTTTSHLDVF